MKIMNIIAAVTMTGTLALAGCSSNNQAASSASKAAEQSNSKEKTTATNVKDGVANLLHDAKQLKKGINANDEAKVKEIGPKFEESWGKFEDGVKSQYPDQYAQVEKYLDPIVAGSRASTIDKDTLLKLNDQLIDVLYQISEKLIPVDQVKVGVSKLLTKTDELKQAINAGDEKKVKEIGPKLEDIWKTFEDGVKPRYPELYEQIEKSLNPEVAGSQVSPLDKQTLGNLNDQLTQTLHDLEQKAN